MTDGFHDTVCVLAAAIYLLAVTIYAVSVYRDKTEPTISTWIVWTVLASALLWSNYQVGGETSIWPAWLILFESAVVLLIVVWKCYQSRNWNTEFGSIDILCFIGVPLALIPWWLFHSEAATFYLDLGLSWLGALPTISAAWKHREEHCLAWTLAVVSQLIYLLVAQNSADQIYSSVILMIDVAIALPLWLTNARRLTRSLRLEETNSTESGSCAAPMTTYHYSAPIRRERNCF